MKDDVVVMLAVLVAVLYLGTKSKPAMAASDRPTIGNNGTIVTADRQFYFDGAIWWQFDPTNPAGYAPIPGQ